MLNAGGHLSLGGAVFAEVTCLGDDGKPGPLPMIGAAFPSYSQGPSSVNLIPYSPSGRPSVFLQATSQE